LPLTVTGLRQFLKYQIKKMKIDILKIASNLVLVAVCFHYTSYEGQEKRKMFFKVGCVGNYLL